MAVPGGEGRRRWPESNRRTRRAALDTGRQRRPDAFAPAASRLAPRALRDLAVDDYRAELLLDAVVGRFHARPLQEGEVVRAVVPETLGEVFAIRSAMAPVVRAGETPAGHTAVPPPTLLRAGFPPMPKAKQHLDLSKSLLPKRQVTDGQRCEKLHVADQIARQNCSLASVSAVKRRYSPA